MGDDLIPSEVSQELNCEATSGHVKGEVIIGKNTGRQIIRKTGVWRLCASDHEPENLDAQISEILNKTTREIGVWQKLSEKYHIDLFCGLFMIVGNEGMDISL